MQGQKTEVEHTSTPQCQKKNIKLTQAF